MNRTEALKMVRDMLTVEEAKLTQAENARNSDRSRVERIAYKNRAVALRWAIAALLDMGSSDAELRAKAGD